MSPLQCFGVAPSDVSGFGFVPDGPSSMQLSQPATLRFHPYQQDGGNLLGRKALLLHGISLGPVGPIMPQPSPWDCLKSPEPLSTRSAVVIALFILASACRLASNTGRLLAPLPIFENY
jgi:hypothetical protein